MVPEVERSAQLDRASDVLVIQAGENDLGLRSMQELVRDIKYGFLRLCFSYPYLLIVWSDIVARTQ